MIDPIEHQMEALHVGASSEPPPIIENVQNSVNVEEKSMSFDPMAERYESFKKAVEAAEALIGKAKKRMKRRGAREKTESVADDDEIALLELRKEIPSKTKQKQRARPVKLKKRYNLDLNFFEDIDIYLANDLPFEDEVEESAFVDLPAPQEPRNKNRESDFGREFDPVKSSHRVLTSTPMNPAHKKRQIISPEDLHVSKRIRTLDSLPEILPDDIVSAPVTMQENIQQESSDVGITIPNLPASIQDSRAGD